MHWKISLTENMLNTSQNISFSLAANGIQEAITTLMIKSISTFGELIKLSTNNLPVFTLPSITPIQSLWRKD